MKTDVLVIHERPELRELLCDILAAGGYECRVADDAAAAEREIRRRRPELALLGELQNAAVGAGLDVLRLLTIAQHPVPVIMIRIPLASKFAQSALNAGAYAVLERPWNSVELLRVSQQAILDVRSRREAAEQKIAPAELVGRSEPMMRLRESIVRLANVDTPVLISGGAGSGKSVTARLVHQKSRRSLGRFVTLDCAAIEAEHLEGELFGFDTADKHDNWAGTVLGVLDQADRGTLFIRNIDALPDVCQRKLYEYLRDGRYERTAGSLAVEADTRVIAASRCDLAQCVEAREFREDLYHELRSNQLRVPSLAERREDIPLLVKHFLNRLSGAAGLSARDLEARALAALQATDWPGNAAELRGLLDRLVADATGRRGAIDREAVMTAVRKRDWSSSDYPKTHEFQMAADEMTVFGQVVAGLLSRTRSMLWERLSSRGRSTSDESSSHAR